MDNFLIFHLPYLHTFELKKETETNTFLFGCDSATHLSSCARQPLVPYLDVLMELEANHMDLSETEHQHIFF